MHCEFCRKYTHLQPLDLLFVFVKLDVSLLLALPIRGPRVLRILFAAVSIYSSQAARQRTEEDSFFFLRPFLTGLSSMTDDRSESNSYKMSRPGVNEIAGHGR